MNKELLGQMIDQMTETISEKTVELIKFAKEMEMTEDQKKLREYGLANEQGELTKVAEGLISEKIMKENTPYLLDLIKKKETPKKEETNKKK